MSWFSRKEKPEAFDLAARQPAVRRSICTGEMTAGYIDVATGKFHEIQLVADQKELEDFFARRGAAGVEIRVIY